MIRVKYAVRTSKMNNTGEALIMWRSKFDHSVPSHVTLYRITQRRAPPPVRAQYNSEWPPDDSVQQGRWSQAAGN